MFAAQYYKFDLPSPLDQLRWSGHHGLWSAGGDGHQDCLPDADVACVTGEGSIQMNIQELSTCSSVRLSGQNHQSAQRLFGHG
jgi:acetolactate synthase-1/2/3 large subunit